MNRERIRLAIKYGLAVISLLLLLALPFIAGAA